MTKRKAGSGNQNTDGFHVDVANEQTILPVDERRLQLAVATVLEGESVRAAEISVAVVDDETIRRLNCQYLKHDYPTDVLSFLLDRDGDRLEGEVIVGAETAARVAGDYGCTPDDELLLYVIHGVLHLVGYLDATPEEQAEMRRRERRYLEAMRVVPREE